MTSRETILDQVRANRLKSDEHLLPELPSFPFGEGEDRTALFLRNFELMGGRKYDGGLAELLREQFANPRFVASAVPDFEGNVDLETVAHPRDLAVVDVGIVRACFGVAETGSLLLLDEALISNAVAYLAQHLVVLLDPADILSTLQDAYRRPEFHRHRYASFHTGPSATADIEGVLIHGAQGVRSLTLVMIKVA